MKTKQIIILLSVAVFCTVNLFGQNKPNRPHRPDPEKFKEMKIAYITEKLSLTEAEAQTFWPVYNEFQSKKENIYKELKSLRKESKKEDGISDQEIEQLLNQRIIAKQKDLDIEKEYLEKFKKVLPIKKVGQFYKAEEGFKRDLLRKMKEKQHQAPADK